MKRLLPYLKYGHGVEMGGLRKSHYQWEPGWLLLRTVVENGVLISEDYILWQADSFT
jgi:hypothetical protein